MFLFPNFFFFISPCSLKAVSSLCFFKRPFIRSFSFSYLSLHTFFLSPVFSLPSILSVPFFFHSCILSSSSLSLHMPYLFCPFCLHPSFNNSFFVSFFSLKVPLYCVFSALPPSFLVHFLSFSPFDPPSFKFLQINYLRAASCRNIPYKCIGTRLSYVLM